MRFDERSDPRSHLVIDDLFSPRELAQLHGEALRAAPLLRIGLRGLPENRYQPSTKRNRNAVITDRTRVGGEKLEMLELVRSRLASPEMGQRLEAAREPLFRLLRFCELPLLHLSAYGDGDYYRPHTDSNDPVNITLLLLLGPRRFEGGTFRLSHGEGRRAVPYRPGRLLVFASNTLHEVTPVRSSSTRLTHARLTLQAWPRLPRSSGRSSKAAPDEAVIRYTTPYFGLSTEVWRAIERSFHTISLKEPWSAHPGTLFHPVVAGIEVLATNLAYLARQTLAGRRFRIDTRMAPASGPRREAFRVTCSFDRRGLECAFGYLAEVRTDGALELRLFCRAGRAGAPPVLQPIPIPSDLEQAGTLAALRRASRLLARKSGLSTGLHEV